MQRPASEGAAVACDGKLSTCLAGGALVVVGALCTAASAAEEVRAENYCRELSSTAGCLPSPGHCANIMSGDFTEMGATYAVNRGSTSTIYWTQVGSRKSPASP